MNLPMKTERTVCSKTLVYKLQTPVNHQEESVQQILHTTIEHNHSSNAKCSTAGREIPHILAASAV
jgi:hypothetical protein